MAATIKVQLPAGPGERFRPGCLDSSIGKRIPLHIPGRPTGECTVLDATVIHDGRAVILTVQIPDEWLEDPSAAHCAAALIPSALA